MYLRADARGRGIGDALLERCLAAAKQFLYVRCYLETVTQMQAALEFYGRHGFRDLQAPSGRTGHEHNDRWMMRTLRASAREGLRGSAGVLSQPGGWLRSIFSNSSMATSAFSSSAANARRSVVVDRRLNSARGSRSHRRADLQRLGRVRRRFVRWNRIGLGFFAHCIA